MYQPKEVGERGMLSWEGDWACVEISLLYCTLVICIHTTAIPGKNDQKELFNVQKVLKLSGAG
jgi:hypothetical protein